MSRILVALLVAAFASSLVADEPAKPEAKPAAKTLSPAELIKKLEKDLTGAKLTGRFTVTGKADFAPREEEYTITSAMKLDEPDLWLIKAHIKYGKTDATYPIPLEIKWAGDTPVITMTNMEIPGLGTFSTRVVIYEGRYAGTWQHGPVGGHLFGTIGKADSEKPAEAKP